MPAWKRRRRVVGAGEWTLASYSGSAALTIEDQQPQPQKNIPENTWAGHARESCQGASGREEASAGRDHRGWGVMAWALALPWCNRDGMIDA